MKVQSHRLRSLEYRLDSSYIADQLFTSLQPGPLSINMAPLRSVSELASVIERHTKALEDGLKYSPGAQFSLAFGAPPQVDVPASLEATRSELLETVDELRARLLGPLGYLMTTLFPVVRFPLPSSHNCFFIEKENHHIQIL